MHLVYYDEAGDDGFPTYSSPLFVLSALYFSSLDWRENFEIIASFKRQLAKDFRFPFKEELHTRELLLNKNPYYNWKLPENERIEIVERYWYIAAQLSAKVIVTAVLKPRLRSATFQVLHRALAYSVQRIENDLSGDAANRFLIITDEGRVASMRQTTRRIQRINYIDSHFSSSQYRREIRHLIEDPLPKSSSESYFIQLCDLIACIVYFHLAVETGHAALPTRMPLAVDRDKLISWLDILKPILNLKACLRDPYGIVCIPMM